MFILLYFAATAFTVTVKAETSTELPTKEQMNLFTDSDYLYDAKKKTLNMSYTIDQYDDLLWGVKTEKDDIITQIVPRECFYNVCSLTHVGKEYGFYISTQSNTVTDKQTGLVTHGYKSDVFIFDISITLSSTANEFSYKVTPLYVYKYFSDDNGVTSEKVLGRELKTYNQQQILLYQGYNFDKYVLNDEASKESHPNISLSALKYIYENTNALPLINLDMEYVGIIDNKNAIKSLGFDLYDNSLEMTDPNYIYVSDYLFDETHNLKNGCLDYSAYIGKEVTVNWKKGILAGVFKTNYTSYVDWDYEHGQFTYKRNLNERDRYKIAFIDNIKNLFFCSQQYYDEHNLNGYIFNSEIKTSERKNGSTTYYGLSELTFSTDIGDVAITKEVRITDEADNGHFDDWGDYIEESFAPNENEIYISRKLYKKLFGVSYDANSADSHLGSTIDISLRENGSEKILSTIKGKVLVGVYGDEADLYAFSIAKETNREFKQYGITHPFTIMNISDLSSSRLTEILATLREKYEVATVSMLSSWVYYVVEEQLAGAFIIMSAVAIVMFLVAILLIVNLVSVNISAKTSEIGILRAMGMRSDDIIFIYLIKIIILAVISFSLSIIGALSGIPIMAKGFMIDDSLFISWIAFDWLTLLIGIIMGIVVPITLSAICLRKINKMKPIDAIKNK